MPRRREPLDIAIRALARRDLSAVELEHRLQRAGVSARERQETIARLREAGYLSDARAALERARVLADRDRGDAAIRADLAGRGIEDALIDAALADVAPEEVRAQRLASRIGSSARLAQTLARRGFSSATVEAIARPVAEES